MIKLSILKPEEQIFVFDKEYNDKRPTLYPVRDFIEAYKERPEDFGKAVIALKVEPDLDRVWIKEVLNDYFNDHAIASEYFYGGEGFTTDDLWDDRTLQQVTMFLEGMLRKSGYFVKPGPLEIDYSELTPAKPEAEPDTAPGGTKIELKPCPCCGSKDVAFYTGLPSGYVVVCNECHLGLRNGLKTKEKAAAEWNRRVNSKKEENQ